jgi:hypothetical protein
MFQTQYYSTILYEFRILFHFKSITKKNQSFLEKSCKIQCFKVIYGKISKKTRMSYSYSWKEEKEDENIGSQWKPPTKRNGRITP